MSGKTMNKQRRDRLREIAGKLIELKEDRLEWLAFTEVISDCNYDIDMICMEEEKTYDGLSDKFKCTEMADRMDACIEGLSTCSMNLDTVYKVMMNNKDYRYKDVEELIVLTVSILNEIIEI